MDKMDRDFIGEMEDICDEKPVFFKRPMRALAIDLGLWVLLTAYAVALAILGQGKTGYTAALLVYVFLSLRLLARHVSMSQAVYRPVGVAYDRTVGAGLQMIPGSIFPALLFLITLLGLITSALVFPLTDGGSYLSRFQSLAGVIVLLTIMYATSSNRRAIPWNTVAAGLLLQFLIALFVLRTKLGFDIFSALSTMIVGFLSFSQDGTRFLIGEYTPTNFVLNVFPAIVFFCSFVYVVYYWGGMQYLILKIAYATQLVMGCSGSEAVVAAASPFIGQGESALLVKPFVEYMTISEIHSSMTSGFATIAGSILLAFISMGVNADLLLTACVMSIPSSLLLSKMRVPETEESITMGSVQIPEPKEREANFLHAATNGAATGVQIILLIGGSVLAVISLYSAFDFLVGFIFQMVNIFDLVNLPNKGGTPNRVSVSLIMSYFFYPFALMMGIPSSEARYCGEILAVKMVVNEFVGFLRLTGAFKATILSLRTFHIMSFALCGFANIASIGIQIGCLGAIAPTRTQDVASLAVSAMLTGTISTWLTAAVAGVIL